jgi:hypothetical protein
VQNDHNDNLFLIAHKVRGRPAFDVAEKMSCPLCAGYGHDLDGYCHECHGERFWWIIPTSGHRAYPYWIRPLPEDIEEAGPIPSDLPDHYPTPTVPREAGVRQPTLTVRPEDL